MLKLYACLIRFSTQCSTFKEGPFELFSKKCTCRKFRRINYVGFRHCWTILKVNNQLQLQFQIKCKAVFVALWQKKKKCSNDVFQYLKKSPDCSGQ